MNRRKFAKNTILTSAMVSVNSIPGISNFLPSAKRNIKKSIMWSCIETGNTIAEKFQNAKQAGFDGVELLSHLDRKEVLKARDTSGLVIPSVCGSEHWNFPLSDPDPKIREKGVEALRITLEDAGAYGADTVLLVPGRVTETVSYDECWKRTVEEIKKALPTAEKLKVNIAIENVWNSFLLSPMEAANYIDQFHHPLVKFYFDCGNVVNFGWPEQWIRILGKRIAKVHIKEFSRKIADTHGKAAGFGVKLTEGDVNWPAVMKAFDDTGYSGWATIEQEGGDSAEGLKDLCDRLVIILRST
jgi:L-ribulose-5-phosphate 3-epimerase